MECSLVTVIVPVYLVEQYLDECITSLLGQTVPFDEIILVVDGSPDHCLEICLGYERKHSNIRVLNKENEGPSIARNLGIMQSKSEYIAFVDGDDFVDPLYMETMQPYLQKGDLDVLCFDAKEINEVAGTSYKKVYNREKYVSTDLCSGYQYLQNTFPRYYTVSPCIAFYKKSMLTEHNIFFPEGLFYEDTLFTFLVLNHAKRIRYLPKQLYVRRYRAGSTMTSGLNERKFSDLTEIILLIWEYVLQFSKEDPGKKAFYRCFIGQYMISILYRMKCENSLSIDVTTYKLKLLKSYLKTQKELGMLKEVNMLTWGETNAALLVMEELNHLRSKENAIRHMISAYIGTESDYKTLEQLLRQKRKEQLHGKLMRLPFDQRGLKVVVYGLGRHTQRLLQLYEEGIGRICCQLNFAVTKPEPGQHYQNKRVYAIGEIPSDTDLVVISSYHYEDEMIECLETYCRKKFPYRTLYDKLDFCDMIDLEVQTNS